MWALDTDFGGWDPAVRAVPFAIGLFLLVTAATSIVRTMVIPRTSISFVYAIVLRSTDVFFSAVARLSNSYRGRDRVLAWSGPIGIILALIAWLGIFLIAYALLIYGVTDNSWLDSLLQAGSGLLTLGLIGTPSEDVSAVDFIAATTGPAVIALLIGFLPTLYQAYLGRESRVLLSTSLSGAPAWGPEILVRVHLLGGDDDLDDGYGEWIPWCAQVRLTQTLYPALSRFRSPVAGRNWLVSLVAVLDSASLRLAITTGPADPRVVAVITQGAQAMLSISATEAAIDSVVRMRPWQRRISDTLRVFGVSQGSQPTGTATATGTAAVVRAITLDNARGWMGSRSSNEPVLEYRSRVSTLPRSEFDTALAYLRSAGVEIQRSDDEAFEIFRESRGRYEAAAYHLAERFYVVRAPWTGDRSPETPVLFPTLAADESTT